MNLTVASKNLVLDINLKIKYIKLVRKSDISRGFLNFADCVDFIINKPLVCFSRWIYSVDVLVVLFGGELDYLNLYFRSKVIEYRHGYRISHDDLSSLDRSIEPFHGLVFRKHIEDNDRLGVDMKFLTTPFVPRYTFDMRVVNCCTSCINILKCPPSLVCVSCETVLCLICTRHHAGRLCICGVRLPPTRRLGIVNGAWQIMESNNVDVVDGPLMTTPKVYALDSRTLSFVGR